jgi:NAD(P) transhydrogenase subunit alpha
LVPREGKEFYAMRIGVPKESTEGENRISLIPDDVAKLVRMGAEVAVETKAGASSWFSDEEYTDAGAVLVADANELLSGSDVIVRVRKPLPGDIGPLKKGAIHISLLDPFLSPETIKQLGEAEISAFSMEMIPRTTYAQKMDVLSSQANLAGYVSVILAAAKLKKILPMMMTPAGTIKPSRVFVLGAGVAGLQAIATAKRLGARVDAFDIRPEAAEQIESLGAKAVKIDLGETESTKDGYAKEITEEQKQKQKEEMAKVCAKADMVITTAQVFGRKAPQLVDNAMIVAMRPGSVIVDMAVATGGNVEGSRPDEDVVNNGVTIMGLSNMPGCVATNASQMYSANVFNFVSEFLDEETKSFKLDLENEIIKATLITHEGAVVNERILKSGQG